MLTRIRNAAAARKAEVVLPYSRMKHQIATILEKEGFVTLVQKMEKSKEEGASAFDQLKIVLKYDQSKAPAFEEIKRVSKPGLRIYRGKESLPIVLNHLGIAIISTSQGLMTNKEAKQRGVGGEVICEVY